jgi:hypothetical protein
VLKKECVTGEWRKLHAEDIRYYNDKIEKTEMGGACSIILLGGMRNIFSVLVGKPERRRPLDGPKYR